MLDFYYSTFRKPTKCDSFHGLYINQDNTAEERLLSFLSQKLQYSCNLLPKCQSKTVNVGNGNCKAQFHMYTAKLSAVSLLLQCFSVGGEVSGRVSEAM